MQPGPFIIGGSLQRDHESGRDGSLLERMAVGMPARDGIEEELVFARRYPVGADDDAGKQVAIPWIGEELHDIPVPELAHGDAQIEQCRPAANGQLPVVWIDNGERSRSIREEIDAGIADGEEPGLRIVDGRCQDRIVEQEGELLSECSLGRERPWRNTPSIHGVRGHHIRRCLHWYLLLIQACPHLTALSRIRVSGAHLIFAAASADLPRRTVYSILEQDDGIAIVSGDYTTGAALANEAQSAGGFAG
jgi:hypothetical protein